MIRPETAEDYADVRMTHALAFADNERVPGLVTALRAAPAALPPMSFVACQVVGHVMVSACRLDAARRIVDVLSLSPLGVLRNSKA